MKYRGLDVCVSDSVEPGEVYLLGYNGPFVMDRDMFERLANEMATAPKENEINLNSSGIISTTVDNTTGAGTDLTISDYASGTITTTGHSWVDSDGTWKMTTGAGTSDISIDAEAVAQTVKDRIEELLTKVESGQSDIVEGWSWVQLGYVDCESVFDTTEEAIEHAQKHALKSKPVTIYQEAQSDGEVVFWRESATYDWNVNMRLVFQPDPRARTTLAEQALAKPCPSCGNTNCLHPRQDEDSFYCALCGRRVPTARL